MRHFIPLLLTMSCVVLQAAPIKTICGDYTYIVPDHIGREEAKRIAAERARLDALASEFGTLISQDNTTYTANRNGNSEITFQSLGGSDVRGEWLGDTEEPTFRFSMDERTGETSVSAHVCGKAREITRSEVPLQVKVLRNGTQPNNEADVFRMGDDMYVSFLSPVDGYLTIFLMGEDKQVISILPYQSQTTGVYRIAANQQYVFFSQAYAPLAERPYVDEYVMTCTNEQETNYLYFVFSTQSFSKPAMPEGAILFEDYNIWRIHLMQHDVNVQVISKTITIKQ